MSEHSNNVKTVQVTHVQKDKEIEMDVALVTGTGTHMDVDNTPALQNS